MSERQAIADEELHAWVDGALAPGRAAEVEAAVSHVWKRGRAVQRNRSTSRPSRTSRRKSGLDGSR